MRETWPERFAETPDVLIDDHLGARRERTLVPVRDFAIGGDEFIVMAGPCSVETERQILATAEHVRRSGARVLRGGAFKPRTSPYSFHGLGLEGLKLLAKARKATGLAIVKLPRFMLNVCQVLAASNWQLVVALMTGPVPPK